MAYPASPLFLYDASVATSLRIGGAQAADGVLIDTWQDQSGAGQHLVQATAGNQPFSDLFGIGGGPAVGFGRLRLPLTTTFMTVAALALTIPFTLVCLFRADNEATVCELSSNVGASSGALLGSSSGFAAQVRGTTNMHQADTSLGEFWATDNFARLVMLTHDGTTMTMSVNGVAQPLAVAGTAPSTGSFSVPASVGANHASSKPLSGAIGLLAGWNHVFSPAEVAATLAQVQTIWKLPTPNQAQVYNTVGVGDSSLLAAQTDNNGTQYEPPRSHAALGTLGLGFRFGTHTNLGVSGATLANANPLLSILNIWQGAGVAALVSGVKNVVIVEGGLNDIPGFTINNAGDATAAANTMLSRMQAIVQTNVVPNLTSLSAVGRPHHVFVETANLGGSALNALQDSARQQFNALVRTNAPTWATANVQVHLIDSGGDLILGTSAGTPPGVPGAQNPNFFVSIHPGRSGQDRWAGLVMNAMAAAGL